ncbi:MAG: peptide deformylase [Clostridiales bacterium]|jgi:peptide deformylase|nr:peptide deformylase [Clostridiales bacterium]
MAYRTIRLYGDRLLTKASKPVEAVDGKIITLLDDMKETLTKHNGLGLAAPQVGILKRVVVIDVRKREGDKPDGKVLSEEGYYELVNPEILEYSGEQQNSEACLSLPGKSATVKRPEKIKVRAIDRTGKPFEVRGDGNLAVALSHEIDHLDGVLYVDICERGTFKDDRDED